jgi:hypothetical protein
MSNILVTILVGSISVFLTRTLIAQETFITGKDLPQQFHQDVPQTYDTNYLIYLPNGYDQTS